MKKSYSKTELTEQSKAVFKNYPTAKVVFGTTRLLSRYRSPRSAS